MVHRTIKPGEVLNGSHTRLAQALVEHHLHTVAVCGFVRDSLEAPQPEERRKEAVVHVRLLEACADWLELLEPGMEPHVRLALYLYLEEVAKVARVVRLQTPVMETDVERLNATLDDVLEVLEASTGTREAVDKSHSDTTV